MMLEAIIGREHGTNRLIMRVNNQTYAISSSNSVPKTVSSNHCRLQVDDNRAMTLSNINSQLNTYVDGLQINSKHITFESRVELGLDHFPVDMEAVKRVVDKILPAPPKTYSIAHLERIWKEYDETRLALQLAEQRKGNWRAGGGVLSLLGILVMFLPLPFIGDYRYVFTGAAFLVALYFFIQGFDSSKSLIVKMRKLDEDFRKKYVCPNPNCNHFLGYIPYDVLRTNTRCSYCGGHYTNA